MFHGCSQNRSQDGDEEYAYRKSLRRIANYNKVSITPPTPLPSKNNNNNNNNKQDRNTCCFAATIETC